MGYEYGKQQLLCILPRTMNLSHISKFNKENSSASNTKSKASNYIRNFFSTVNFLSEGFHLI